MAKKPLHVALLIETSNSYARGLLRGVYAYLREHRPWSIYLPEQGRGEAPPDWLNSWHGDGIIARVENSRIAKAVRKTGAPVVDVSATRLMPELPSVETDNEAIARLAFDHLVERGFRNLAYCGDYRFQWSVERAIWFSEFARDRGCSLAVYPPANRKCTAPVPWEEEEKELAAWVRHLPKPCGMMASYDIRGRQVLDICRRMGVVVPNEIAVVGVDDDDLVCNLTDPPLTSVVPDTHRTGFEAAELLDQMMAGREVAGGLRAIKPKGIVTRQSSDTLATADADVFDAVRFIRDHAYGGIKVEDVLKSVPVSRRVLESRFKKVVGHTPHEEILRVQLQRVRQLLATTDLSLTAIAAHTGFKHVEYMCVVFKRRFQQTAGHFRADHRAN